VSDTEEAQEGPACPQQGGRHHPERSRLKFSGMEARLETQRRELQIATRVKISNFIPKHHVGEMARNKRQRGASKSNPK
jgi:hypothetical protein